MSSWDTYWSTVGNEDYLYARELIELSGAVHAHFARHITGEDLDWRAAAAAADDWPASSGERRLLDLVLSIVNPDVSGHHETRDDDEGPYEVWVTTGVRKVDARDLGNMGSWREEVASIMGRYIAGAAPKPLRHSDG